MSTDLTNPPFPDAGDMTELRLVLVRWATHGLMVFIITPLTMMDDATDQSETGAGARDQSEASTASHLCQGGEGQ